MPIDHQQKGASFKEITKKVKYLIIGAGPTGLGALTRLHEHGESDVLLLEAESEPGGLAKSVTTPEGFTFDFGGHVMFSHYSYFDDLINAALGSSGPASWVEHPRKSFVVINQCYVPYPFQKNLDALPPPIRLDCIKGLNAAKVKTHDPINTFDDWIVKTFGIGIAKHFMRPYNFKVWAYHPSDLQFSWVADRIALASTKTSSNWGPNSTFRYPKNGGTGLIWKSVAKNFVSKIRYNTSVSSMNMKERRVQCQNGDWIQYEKLLTTIPLNVTLSLLKEFDLASRLLYSSTHVIGIGLRKSGNGSTRPYKTDSSWFYYPQDTCPFYRATILSNYNDTNVPDSTYHLQTLQYADGSTHNLQNKGPYWSLLFEVSESKVKNDVCAETIVQDVLDGAICVSLLQPKDEVVSIYYKRIEYGYPTPHLQRDEVLKEALPMLKENGIWSRGRFGGYKYEVGNQDHSVMQGVEAIDNMLDCNQCEDTIETPARVNSQKNYRDRKFMK